ncbi:hypothetical protein P8S55_09870 [Halomonas sp. M1]|jgi:hypothetical protein|uniref:hypothetical protein n=1 Tax=Halomonas sp. M1 TaxID=3035470 RepID=UPI0024854C20|nr:hypothetical protein [Halomonas sp. M1]WFE70098.1 hypothetical protein P8S55_09870 [Halomonas sp. M1]
MKEETQIELAKLSMQLTVALLQDSKGSAQAFRIARGLTNSADPLDMFDKIHDHLTAKISKE